MADPEGKVEVLTLGGYWKCSLYMYNRKITNVHQIIHISTKAAHIQKKHKINISSNHSGIFIIVVKFNIIILLIFLLCFVIYSNS